MVLDGAGTGAVVGSVDGLRNDYGVLMDSKPDETEQTVFPDRNCCFRCAALSTWRSHNGRMNPLASP